MTTLLTALLSSWMAVAFGAMDWALCVLIQISALIHAVADVAASSRPTQVHEHFRNEAYKNGHRPWLKTRGARRTQSPSPRSIAHRQTYQTRPQRMCQRELAIYEWQRQQWHPPQQQQRHQNQQPCFIQRLPNEVLMVVFEMIGAGPDLLSCTLVSRRWHGLVTPILWQAPVPSYPICCLPPFMVSPNPLNELSIRRHTRLSRSSFSGCSTSSSVTSTSTASQSAEEEPVHGCFPSSSFPIHLAKYGHAIRRLDLPHIHLTDCSLRHIAMYCPNLLHISMEGSRITNHGLAWLSQAACAPRLQSISLRNCRQITNSGLRALAKTCHNLTSVNLAGCIRIAHQGVTDLVANNPCIRSLDVSDCGRVTGATLREIAKSCTTQLECLNMARIRAVSHADIQHLVEHCPNLKQLNMAKQKRLRRVSTSLNEPLDELIETLRRYNIQPDLSLDSYQHHQQLLMAKEPDTLSDNTLLLVASRLPQLTHLDISHWTTLTNDAVGSIVRQARALTFLGVAGCPQITCRAFGCKCREEHHDRILKHPLAVDGLTAASALA